MSRKFSLAIMVFAFAGSLCAQTTISVMPPASGMVNRQQLWNIVLSSFADQKSDAFVRIEIFNIGSGQVELVGTSTPIQIFKGTKVLNFADLSPIQYSFESPALSKQKDGFVPVGMYKACYTLNGLGLQSEIVLAEICISFEVQPLSPPRLIYPEDSALINERYPQFNWIPPMPTQLFSNLNYDILLTEKKVYQSTYEAIQENIPIYHMFNLTDIFQLYPSSSPALDTGKIYVWRIVAKNDDDFVSQSEVWQFSIAKPDSTKDSIPNSVYYNISEGLTTVGNIIIQGKLLLIKFQSSEADYETDLTISDSDGKTIDIYKRKVRYGENYWTLQLGNKYTEDKIYRFSFQDNRRKSHGLTFSIQ